MLNNRLNGIIKFYQTESSEQQGSFEDGVVTNALIIMSYLKGDLKGHLCCVWLRCLMWTQCSDNLRCDELRSIDVSVIRPQLLETAGCQQPHIRYTADCLSPLVYWFCILAIGKIIRARRQQGWHLLQGRSSYTHTSLPVSSLVIRLTRPEYYRKFEFDRNG